MNSSSKFSTDERFGRHRRLLIVVALAFAACAACAAVLIGVFAWAVDDVETDLLDQEMNCCWEAGATPAWMSGQLGIRIPEAASDRRAGYKVGERHDTGLLSFVLPSKEAETYTGRLLPEDTTLIGNFHPKEKDYRPAAAFSHLGLAEPETLVRGLRQVSLCPDDLDSPEGTYLRRCVDLFAHEFRPGTTRVYVRSTIEPGVTPPPASPGP
ncbi:hypothetical protein ACFYXM_27495 [Streptomyces sp. NPDC002476]|uniref:hypothetical protein n=1 Tax=Streptomyces sp. NPDC002476 TaxID=3364648 RepID=UPI003678C08C